MPELSLPPDPMARAARLRRRAAASLAFAAVLLLGLASRRWPAAPELFGKYPGDALWALMVFFGWTALRPGAGAAPVASLAGATCLAIECLKLWQAPWLVETRHTVLGHLVFGHVFSWRNLVAYGVGVLAGTACHPWLPTVDRTRASPLDFRIAPTGSGPRPPAR